jgi:hypothetical protein
MKITKEQQQRLFGMVKAQGLAPEDGKAIIQKYGYDKSVEVDHKDYIQILNDIKGYKGSPSLENHTTVTIVQRAEIRAAVERLLASLPKKYEIGLEGVIEHLQMRGLMFGKEFKDIKQKDYDEVVRVLQEYVK